MRDKHHLLARCRAAHVVDLAHEVEERSEVLDCGLIPAGEDEKACDACPEVATGDRVVNEVVANRGSGNGDLVGEGRVRQ